MRNNLLRAFFSAEIGNSVFLCILLLYILFSLDVATTTMILSLGGYEVNMVMAPFVENSFFHLLLKGLVLVMVGSTAQWAEGRIPGSGLMMLLVIIGWYSLVVLNNTSVLVGLAQDSQSLLPIIITSEV
jgi:hypothetical protein